MKTAASSLRKAFKLVVSIGIGCIFPQVSSAQTINFVTTNGDAQEMNLLSVESMVFRNNHITVNTEDCAHQYFNMYHHTTLAMGSLAESAEELAHISIQLDVFPNPVTETLNLSWGETSSNRAMVFGTQGNLIESFTVTGGRAELDVSSLPKGLYILVLGHYTTKFMKQ